MRKKIALALLSCLGLMTESHAATPVAQNECCEPCAPCCVPQPKKCIDCECYTPAFYDLQCDWGLFLTGDFLYWYARETNLAYAMKITNQPGNPALPNNTSLITVLENEYLKTKWDPGFRIGLGMNMGCDGWDAFLVWTSYHNKKTNSTSVPADFRLIDDPSLPGVNELALLNPWLDANLNAGILFALDQISAKWDLKFNQIDLELGRKYWLSRCFTMRPYAGLRGAWIETKFHVDSERNAFVPAFGGPATLQDHFNTHSWGVGLLAGIEPNWYFCSNFVLFANLDASLLWGRLDAKKKEIYAFNPSMVESQWKSNFFMMFPALDLSLGLRWEETWCCDRYRTGLDLGWENHVWFDYTYRNKSESSFISNDNMNPPTVGFSSVTEVASNLMMGGFVLRARFDF